MKYSLTIDLDIFSLSVPSGIPKEWPLRTMNTDLVSIINLLP